jgi:hypothetical protein
MKIRTAAQALEQQRRDHEPGGFAQRARAAAAALPPEQKKGTVMKKGDIFKSDYLQIDALANGEMTLTIASVTSETFKYNGGKVQEKAVLHFKETDKRLPLNSTNWDRIFVVTRKDDTDDWPGERITLYKDNYWDEAAQEARPCIRVSTIKPTAEKKTEAVAEKSTAEKKTEAVAEKPKKGSLRDDLDDEIPEYFNREK